MSKRKLIKLLSTYLIFNVTPVGTPSITAAVMVDCLLTFFSAPYSRIAPNVPALKN